MHSAAPVWPLYLPAAHRTQVPPLGPDEPALHVQSSAESLPDGEFARVGQLEHVEEEELVEYLPATQLEHVDEEELAEYSPATHAIHVDEELAAEYLPVTHAVHVDDDAAEYVPAKQFEHITAPDVQDCCTETSAYKVLPLHVQVPTALDV